MDDDSLKVRGKTLKLLENLTTEMKLQHVFRRVQASYHSGIFINGILFVNKKEWHFNTHMNLVCNAYKHGAQHAEWKKLGMEEHIFHDSIYTKCLTDNLYKQ
jgi:deoxyadenosine/deoxycytidine kinase